jgi:DNA-binding MarR family transcriptional regulator
MDPTELNDAAQVIAALLPRLVRDISPRESDPADELPLAQLRVCGILASEGPRPMSFLSRELGVSLSAMTQIADRLERTRLVTRVAGGDDRRVRCLQLTARGEKIMQHRQLARVRRVAAVLETLSPGSRGEIRAALETLFRACKATYPSEAVPAVPCVPQPDSPPSEARASS